MKLPTTFPLLALLAALFVTGCADAPSRQTGPEQKLALSKVTLEAESARRMINSYRQKRGLPPLTLETLLTRAAMRHAKDLAKGDRISHTGSDGSDPWARVAVTGYRPKLAAENVGAGQRSFAEVLQGWISSPGHNKNLLLADAVHMGIALETRANSRYQTFWTLVLGKPDK